eukprot:5832497-Prymnesium_polylepis.1
MPKGGLSGVAAERERRTFESVLRRGGACVCFECAVPVLDQRWATRARVQRASVPAPAAASGGASSVQHGGAPALHRPPV